MEPEEVENGGQRLTPLGPVDNPATAGVAIHENGGRSFSPLDHRSLTPAETLPSQWYRDDRIHQLERRAIFSKSWILVTHVSRFAKEGDYVAFEMANFPILGRVSRTLFLLISSDHTLRFEQNVCRHRGYPLVSKLSGCAPVIGCAYHGWCYAPADGRLVKSTHTSFPSFDPSKYSLFKIHTHVMRSGFIFVNLAVQDPPPFHGWFGDLEDKWQSFRSDDYEYAYSWTDTRFKRNWPLRTELISKQECVHCHTSHPGYAASLDLSTYAVETKTRYALHITTLKPGTEQAQSTSVGSAETEGAPSFAYVFPSNAVTVTNVLWYMMRVVPISATQTRMEYDVFKRKSISLERLRAYMQFYEKVEDEDFHLVTATQKSLNTGIYRRGSLHPTKENGVIYYQGLVRTAVEDHLAEEQRLGHEWNPAQPLSQGGGRGDTRYPETDAVCRVSCLSGAMSL
ncbi:ISP domain-containing protein [Calocera viscosa TUFC12733]|uniref:Choline monooxygenase, chloroplastic n=1 Tax=Calocera viscosa (strain TUFC12733) TaxID=1330018 RepID=A0A167IHU0_CALVF|nr:ISP domain-containing protein [Calocera viscosa TUFC12733]